MKAGDSAAGRSNGLRIPESVTPRKRHGQNFLVDPSALEFEVRSARLNRSDTVLEVGPGTGNLTRRLALAAGTVVAVEIDRQFEPQLESLCQEHPNVRVIWGDALEVDWPAYGKVVANLPYSLALPLIFRFLERPLDAGVVVVQMELAQRLCAEPGEPGYGAITAALRRIGRFRLLRTVGRRAFFPPPDVDSAVVGFEPETCPFDIPDGDLYRRVLDHLFLRRTRRVESALKEIVPGASVGGVLGLVMKTVRGRLVLDTAPEDFGQIAWALRKRGVSLPAVSGETKRTAQRRFR